jgi:hypothetical protein
VTRNSKLIPKSLHATAELRLLLGGPESRSKSSKALLGHPRPVLTTLPVAPSVQWCSRILKIVGSATSLLLRTTQE